MRDRIDNLIVGLLLLAWEAIQGWAHPTWLSDWLLATAGGIHRYGGANRGEGVSF